MKAWSQEREQVSHPDTSRGCGNGCTQIPWHSRGHELICTIDDVSVGSVQRMLLGQTTGHHHRWWLNTVYTYRWGATSVNPCKTSERTTRPWQEIERSILASWHCKNKQHLTCRFPKAILTLGHQWINKLAIMQRLKVVVTRINSPHSLQ